MMSLKHIRNDNLQKTATVEPAVSNEKSSEAWKRVAGTIYAKFQNEAESVLFDMGNRYGTDIALEATNRGLGPVGAFEILAERSAALGLGRLSVSGQSSSLGEDLVVRVEDCAFCANASTIQPSCHFLRGIVMGAVQMLFGGSMCVIERICRASGGSFCEFTMDRAYSEYKLV